MPFIPSSENSAPIAKMAPAAAITIQPTRVVRGRKVMEVVWVMGSQAGCVRFLYTPEKILYEVAFAKARGGTGMPLAA